MSGGPIFQKKIQSAHDRKDSKTIRRVGRGGGGGGGGRGVRPPPAEKVRLKRAKDKLIREKRTPKMNLFLQFVNARSFSQWREQT